MNCVMLQLQEHGAKEKKKKKLQVVPFYQLVQVDSFTKTWVNPLGTV